MTREVSSSSLMNNPSRSFRSAIRPAQSVGCFLVVGQDMLVAFQGPCRVFNRQSNLTNQPIHVHI
jgi:hypothetical protein